MINSICDIFSSREKQLEIQEKQDNIINEKGYRCPLVFLKLLMLERTMNREQLRLHKNTANIFSIIKNTQDNMEKIDNYQEELQEVLKSKFVCHDLEKFIKKYE